MRAAWFVLIVFLSSSCATIPAAGVLREVGHDAKGDAPGVLNDIVDVMVDEAHGNLQYIPGEISYIASYLREYGFNFKSIYSGTLAQSLLQGYEVLVLMFPSTALTQGELDAVRDFVNSGGGLLLVGTASASYFKINNPSYTTNDNLNQIATTYGVTFNNDDFSRIVGPSEIPSNEFLNNTASLVYNSGATLQVTGPTEAVLTSSGKILMAKNGANQRRIFFMGSVWALNMPRDERLTRETDHYQLALNVFSWLAGKEPSAAVSGMMLRQIVAPGPVLTDEQTDGYLLIKGSSHTHCQQGSTDSSTPASEMVEEARQLSFDYVIWTDHDSDGHPWSGYAAALTHTQQKGYDMYNAPGVEVSQGFAHIVVYPVTEDWTLRSMRENTLQGLLPLFEEIESAGGLIVYAHPLLMQDTENLYFRIRELGWDGMEIVNSAIQMGAGDVGAEYFNYSFTVASDAHSTYALSRAVQYLYVHNVTDAAIVDAVKNRRVIGYVPLYNLWLGEQVWLDEFFERMGEAEYYVDSVRPNVDPNNPLAAGFLHEAELALENSNPDRAKRYGKMALEAPSPTPTPSPTPQPTTTSTIAPTPSATPTPAPTPTPEVSTLPSTVVGLAIFVGIAFLHSKSRPYVGKKHGAT